MEYVQLVLAQVESDRLEEALRPGGLLERLDNHRKELEGHTGFLDMRVVKSINRKGKVQLVIETRWADDQSLIDYETGAPTIVSILEEFGHLLVPNSLQVVDMEALRSEDWWQRLQRETEVKERVLFPLLLPLGAFLFGVLVIYGLSRIYLELAHWHVGDVKASTPMALGISALILAVGWWVATRPHIKGWQVAAIIGIAVAGLLAGAIWAAVHEEGKTGAEASSPRQEVTYPIQGGGPQQPSSSLSY